MNEQANNSGSGRDPTGRRFTVGELAQWCGISRQAYYQARRRRDACAQRQGEALALVRQVRQKHPRMGTRKIYHLHYERFRGLKIGRDALFALLAQEGLLVERKRRTVRTTDSRHGLPTWQNLLIDTDRDGIAFKRPRRPNEVFVSDITYIETLEGFSYLALITDAYSRKIVGWDLCESLSVEGSQRALTMALLQASAAECRGLIHHSDRGVQYCCHHYIEQLEEVGARVSMAQVGNPYENALAERINGILKQEYALGSIFVSRHNAQAAVREAIYLYNEERPHLSLHYQTPSQVHSQENVQMCTWPKRAA